MLRRLLRALWGPAPSPAPRLREVLERVDALEGDVAGLRKRVKSVEGQLSGGKRANEREEGPEDAPGRTIAEPEPLEYLPAAPGNTSHLARRFRLGG